jgi:hypothetical protein
MSDQRPPHHPAIDALLAADLSEDDLYILGSAIFAVNGKLQHRNSGAPAWGGGRLERWVGGEFRKSLIYFATGVDVD